MDLKRVFIVDDILSDRTLLSVAFKKAGYKVYLAKDGIEAYLKFFKLKPDVVLVDVLLPKMRGDTLIRWIKGTPPGKEIPFLVVSGHTQMRDYLYQLGIDVFFKKPCKTKDVLEATEEVLNIYETKKSLNMRVRQVKERFDKSGKSEIQPQVLKQKLCEVCQNLVSLEEIRCPHCDNVRLHIVEIPESPASSDSASPSA